MRSGWEGNTRLQDFVRRVDSGAGFVVEVATVDGVDIIQSESEWSALTTASGSITSFDRGGVAITATETTLLSHGPDDGTTVTNLTTATPFNALLIEHIGVDAESREFHTLTARLDPRANGGNPKTVDHFIAEIYRVAREGTTEGEIFLELLGRSDPVDATGEVEADFDFSFATPSGRYPVAGPPPLNASPSRPQTLVRIIAYQADGALADNVAWMTDSAEGATKTNGSSYSVTHYSVIASTNEGQAQEGASVYELGSAVASMPEFSFTRSNFATTVKGAVGDNEIADISGSGDLTLVARGETPADSTLTWEIYDGTSTWYEFVDGDIIGQDNETTINGVVFGNDLSSVPTTGPWDVRVTLTPSTGGLRTPIAREIGVERISTTSFAKIAEMTGGARRLDPLTLKAAIPKASIHVMKSGEKDFRDPGTLLLSGNHIGYIEVRVWVGDPSGTYLHRSEWLLHSIWEIEDYENQADRHVLNCLSPLRRLRIPIPPFVPTSGNDGTRDAVEVSGTRKAAWAEVVDTLAGLPARWRGPGVEDTTHSIQKTITEGDAKDEADRIALLGGDTNIESQGRIKAVAVMRDEPVDYIHARFPIGSYTPRRITPGYGSRVDEYFVPYAWSDTDGRFENERRYLNATAIEKLGGAGLNTTQKADAETSKWVITEALADAFGARAPKHLGNGLILWEIDAIERNPQLELGDMVAVETDMFVARSPINDQPIRGRLVAPAIVAGVFDRWGQRLELWVPGFEYISIGSGDVTYEVGPVPVIFGVDERMLTAGVVNSEQAWNRELTVYHQNTQSIEIEHGGYLKPLGIDDPGWPSTIVSGYTYTASVTPGQPLRHVIQAGGSDATYALNWDENNLLPGAQGGATLTLTPYSKAAGAGLAGRAITVTAKSIPDYEDLVRIVETVDRRIDNNDTPGIGGFDLDLDNASNGFAFEWTNNEGESVDISVVRFYLKATGSPTGSAIGRIYSDVSSLPSAILATTSTLDVTTVTGSYVAYDLDFAAPYTVANGTTVHVGIAYSAGTASDYVSVEAENAGSHSELNGSWAAGVASRSLLWRLYVEDQIERVGRRLVFTGSISGALSSDNELEITG